CSSGETASLWGVRKTPMNCCVKGLEPLSQMQSKQKMGYCGPGTTTFFYRCGVCSPQELKGSVIPYLNLKTLIILQCVERRPPILHMQGS
ncbi:MAG: hypothetical protein QW632_02415, partial [Ignisphaera sp.]